MVFEAGTGEGVEGVEDDENPPPWPRPKRHLRKTIRHYLRED
jgi:hypothetical protein